jgi:molybdopterin/thiamine biosynthesis adenylyltransferase
VRPVLKSAVWERVDGGLRVVYDLRDQFVIEDAEGGVEALLGLLAEGGRTVPELAAALGVPVDDVDAAIGMLDDCGLVEDGDPLHELPVEVQERHFSNLAFFESFASLSRGRTDLCRALWDAHVLVLGTGGLNSNVLPHLAGLGVGRLTLLDQDVVQSRNFARQYLYRYAEIGARKVDLAAEWVRHFDPSIDVTAIHQRIDSPQRVVDLLDRYRPNAVVAGVDSPDQIDAWVNLACVPAGVPFVRGGMWVTQGVVWSVDPGRSACVNCRSPQEDSPQGDQSESAPGVADLAAELATVRLHGTRPRTNRGTGPVAGLLGSLAAFEVLRYLTCFEPPAYAGQPLMIDFAKGCAMHHASWSRDPHCTVCAAAPGGPRPVRQMTLAERR